MGRLTENEIYEQRRERIVEEAVYKWWESLTEKKQYLIMLEWYPTEVKEDTDIDKMFGDMPFENQYEIYKKGRRAIRWNYHF